MTRKEKIIEILKSNIHLSFIEDELTGSDHPAMTHKYHSELTGFEQSADAIMALSLDVPSEEEIHDYCTDPFDENIERCSFNTAKWMRDEILKRNSKDDFADV